MLTVWFIDDNENFLEAIHECLGIDEKEITGKFKDIQVSFLDAGIDGSSIVSRIRNTTEHTANIPDIIFLDLRYPIDKRIYLQDHSESIQIDDPMKLSGIKILDALIANKIYQDTCPIIFSEVSLTQQTKDKLQGMMNLNERQIRFIQKFPALSDMKIKIDGIDNFIATKNCDSIKALLTKLYTTMEQS